MNLDVYCENCDGRLCMACVCREVHDACVDDCPLCCIDFESFDDVPVGRAPLTCRIASATAVAFVGLFVWAMVTR